MILIIAVMMLSSVNFMCNISDLYEAHVAEVEQKAAAQLASAHMMCAVPVISLNAARASASYAAYKEENRWKGPVLSKRRGVIYGPSGKETYYNLNMSVVVRAMQRMGYDYEYRRKHRKEMLETTVEQIKAWADPLEKVLESASVCVVGNEQVLKDCGIEAERIMALSEPKED